MGTLSDIFGFEKFQLKDWFKKAKKNPEQLLLGAAEPFGAKLWGGILGKDYEPFVSEWGGPTSQTFGRAEAAGINTSSSATSHEIAKAIAQLYTGKYAMGKVGGMFGGTQGINPQAQMPNAGIGSGVSPDFGAAGVQPSPVPGSAVGGPERGFMPQGNLNQQLMRQMMGRRGQGGQTDQRRRLEESNKLIAAILSRGGNDQNRILAELLSKQYG